MKGADVIVLAVRQELYLKLDPDQVVKKAGNPVAIAC